MSLSSSSHTIKSGDVQKQTSALHSGGIWSATKENVKCSWGKESLKGLSGWGQSCSSNSTGWEMNVSESLPKKPRNNNVRSQKTAGY